MDFLRQTWMLAATGLRSLPERIGAALVTVIGVTTVVAVLVSLLALVGGASSMVSTARPDMATAYMRGAPNPPSGVLPREALLAVMNAPGLKHAPDGAPYVVGSLMVSVDALRMDGRRGTVFLVGETAGAALVDSERQIIEGRSYRAGVRELIVPDTVRRMYRGFGIGDRVTLRGTEWTVVGVFTAPAAVSASVLHADAATVMSAFGVNVYNEARVVLASPGTFDAFKRALESDPAIRVDVKSEVQIMKDVFGVTIMMLNFIVYFIGGSMAFGAVCGALNSLYASVDARRRELATLRAVGYRGGPIVVAVLIEGMLLALPGALLGGAIAWLFFNGHQTAVVGFAVDLKITPQMIRAGIFWALAIGLIGASLPALRVIRTPIAKGLQAV